MKILKLLLATVLLMLSTSAFAGYGDNVEANANADTQSASNQGQSIDSHDTVQASNLGQLVPGVVAPALTTTLTETCMGSTSMGVGWSGAGFSFGTTWRDSACVRRLDARQLVAIHPNLAIVAKELMCDSDKVYEAMKRAKMPCVARPDDKREKVIQDQASIKEERLSASEAKSALMAKKKAELDAKIEAAAAAGQW